jgi:hypothetical protein
MTLFCILCDVVLEMAVMESKQRNISCLVFNVAPSWVQTRSQEEQNAFQEKEKIQSAHLTVIKMSLQSSRCLVAILTNISAGFSGLSPYDKPTE